MSQVRTAHEEAAAAVQAAREAERALKAARGDLARAQRLADDKEEHITRALEESKRLQKEVAAARSEERL